jgi:hypothetical protein
MDQTNQTDEWNFEAYARPDTHENGQMLLLFYSVSPILLGINMVIYTACVLVGKAIDPILSVSAAMCLERLMLLDRKDNPSIQAALCLSLVGMCMRVVGEYRLPDNLPHDTQQSIFQLSRFAFKREEEGKEEQGGEADGAVWT